MLLFFCYLSGRQNVMLYLSNKYRNNSRQSCGSTAFLTFSLAKNVHSIVLLAYSSYIIMAYRRWRVKKEQAYNSDVNFRV